MAGKSSTQKYLDIEAIRESVVIMKDGTIRAVLMVSSINFALKSEDEQNALISGYMEFINSIDHTMQIVIQSRKLDIEGYIRRLVEARKKLTNDLLKMQISNYIDYINELIEIGEIMTKRFFVVVPYNPLGAKAKSFWSRLKSAFKPGHIIKLQRKKFLEYKEQLGLRVSNIEGGLSSLGLDVVILDTPGLIELYYNVYNPKTSQSQPLKEVDQFDLEM